MKSSIKLVASLLLLIFGSLAAFAQAPGAAAQVSPFLDKLDFPEVEGWTRGAKKILPTGEDGVTVNYDSPSRERITVYVYRREEGGPAKDLTGVIKEEFNGARDAIRMVADAGVYSEFKEIKSETVTMGGATGKVKALRSLLTFKVGSNKMNSEIYVFPYNGYVTKFRVTRPADVAKERDDAYAKLLAAMDAFFSKPINPAVARVEGLTERSAVH